MDWLTFLEKGIWFGLAAVGFAILFNVPTRTLKVIFLIGALGGLIKTTMLMLNVNIVLATLAGSIVVGFISTFAAHKEHAPPMIFAIPSVIPMVPGVFAYRMMLGLMTLTGDATSDTYQQVMAATINNGLKATFILLTLAAGVAIPILITRKESVKKLK